jgi:hypothetical protein
MTPEKQQELNQYIQAIAKIRPEEADPNKIQNLEGIEETIREQTLEYITPQLVFFYRKSHRNSSGKTEKNKKYYWRTNPDRKTSNSFKYSS